MTNLIGTTQLKATLSIGKTTLIRLREEGQLLEGIHYNRIPGGRKFLWNLALVQDFFATGGGSSHQQAISAYLNSLPSNQNKKVGRKKSDEK
jgi:hypothetical protein